MECCATTIGSDCFGGRSKRGDCGTGAWIGFRPIWDAGSAGVQRKLHGAGHGPSEYGRFDRNDNHDARRSRLLRNDYCERKCCWDMGHSRASEFSWRAEHDVLCRKHVEGQWRVPPMERKEFSKFRKTIGRGWW